MNIIHDFVNTYGAAILYTVLTAFAGYIGIVVKNIYNKYIDDITKKDVVKTCVRAVEQIYTELHGREKLDKCLESASEMLAQKGITITDVELRMLIEATVNKFNSGFNGIDDNESKAGD